FDK
ncbi:ATP cone domain protein, partial [Chlamydia psittaci 06-1683]